MVYTNKIPEKPKHRKRTPFLWWRRFKSHKYLPVSKGLLARIQNGDFEYPDLFTHAKWEMHWMKEEQEKFIKEYKGFNYMEDNLYHDIERKYRKRYNKCIEDAHDIEMRHLNGLVDELCKEFSVTKEYVRDIMDTWDDTTESLYYHIIKDQGMNVDTYIKLKQSKRKNK